MLVPGEGQLWATLVTSRGAVRCRLAEDRAPATVANFVALALGRKPWYDPGPGRWSSRPLYRDLPFHRLERGFLVATGAPAGQASANPGYAFPDETHPDLRHDAAGVLGMENHGPDTNGSRFYVTLAPAPHLDSRHTIFGHCEGIDVLARAARRRRGGLQLERVDIERKEPGASSPPSSPPPPTLPRAP